MDAEQFAILVENLDALRLLVAVIERWAFYGLCTAWVACGVYLWRAFHHYRAWNLGERMPK